MAVKEGNMFAGGNGGGYEKYVKLDVLTGKMFTQGVIDSHIKPMRQQKGVEFNATFKDPVSLEIRKELITAGVQPIDSVSGHIVGINISERDAGEGVAREAFIRLKDADGVTDTVVLDLNNGAGQMAIHKLKHVSPGDEVSLKLFSTVSEEDADGKTYVNHVGAVYRADGSNVTLTEDAEVKALHKKLNDVRSDLAVKKASKALVSATISDIKVTSAMKAAKEVEAKLEAFKLKDQTPKVDAAFTEEDAKFGDEGFDNDGAGKTAAPKP
jgi:hypothetical protein